MKNIKYYILALVAALTVASCSDENEQVENDVRFCVKAAWENGRSGDTRAAITSLLDDNATSGGELTLPSDAYPDEISVSCNGKEFKLTYSSTLEECSVHQGFFHGYISDYALKDIEAKKGVTASATIDGGDKLYCENSDVELDGTHLKFTMHHRKALIRFAFKVGEKYDKIRYIKITGIKLNGTECPVVEKVLSNSSLKLIAYAYIDPASFQVTQQNTLACTYNIYDKDPSTGSGQVATDEHLTRKDVVAKNTFKLSSLKDKGSNPVTELKTGYYYDLNVTLNPDYLYVLSEHDNKHITIE